MKRKLGIIGLGYIGQTIIDAINEEKLDVKIQAVYDIDEEKMQKIKSESSSIRLMSNAVDFQDCEVIVECATQQVVDELFDAIVESEKYFVPMSIGAFIAIPNLYAKYIELDEESRSKILLPSGAIGGFDCIETINLEQVKSARLITRKPNRVFSNHEYVTSHKIKLNDDSPTTIFEGNAKLAASSFPRSINVAARLALSTLGPEDTYVEIIADPEISQNIHMIDIESTVGSYSFTFKNNPSPTNPKTSWLAALSAIYAIKQI